MTQDVASLSKLEEEFTPRREGIPERLRLDKPAPPPESCAVRSRASSPHTSSSISTPTNAAFNVLTPGSTPKASAIPQPPLAPTQATTENGGTLAESTSQPDWNAARAALADVRLIKANTDPPEHYGRHPESSASTSSQPGKLVISIDAARAVSLAASASASSSRNTSPSAPKPPTFPRRHSESLTSQTSRRSSNSSIPHETTRRRLSTSSTHLLSPRTAAESSSGWTPTDVQHSPVTEGVVDLFSSSTNSSVLSTSASTSSLKFELIVRDFAYPSDDPRFKGLPHPDEVNDKRDSSSRASRLSGLNSPAFGNDAFGPSSSSTFSWGFVTSHATDFNTSEDDSQLYSEDDTSSRSDFDYTDSHSTELNLGEFVPGIYSAMYDFTPELETEISINTGQLVTVFSRQCAGWVQAAKVGQDGNVTGEMGLVPENYLELIQEGEFVLSEMSGVEVGDEEVKYHDETPLANEVNPYEEEKEDMDESLNGPRRGGNQSNDEDGSKVSSSSTTPTIEPRTEA